MLALLLIKSAATRGIKSTSDDLRNFGSLEGEETFTIFVFVLVKHFSLGCLAEGYVRIILVYRCFHCNNPELIVWKLHQSRAPAPEPGVNSKYT